jgi:hypothetical protein
VLGCALLVPLRPVSIFPAGRPNEQQALMTVGSGLILVIYLYLLMILVPISVWWLILFTRHSVKTQFQSGKATRSRVCKLRVNQLPNGTLAAGTDSSYLYDRSTSDVRPSYIATLDFPGNLQPHRRL